MRRPKVLCVLRTRDHLNRKRGTGVLSHTIKLWARDRGHLIISHLRFTNCNINLELTIFLFLGNIFCKEFQLVNLDSTCSQEMILRSRKIQPRPPKEPITPKNNCGSRKTLSPQSIKRRQRRVSVENFIAFLIRGTLCA